MYVWVKKMALALVVLIEKLGYVGIICLMFLESSFFPFPSEVVIPPAGYLCSIGEMNIYFVVISGIIGSLLGALFNYYLALLVGRPFILKYGYIVGVTEERYAKAERFFNRHGEISTFVGRLLPVIRQYISFPAGLSKMNVIKFLFFTGAGAGIWVVVLALIGFWVGNNVDLVHRYIHITSYVLIIVVIIVIILYALVFKKR